MKHIKKFNENVDNKIESFYLEYKNLLEDDSLDNIDIFNAIGELTLKYDLSQEDILFILDNYDTRFDVNRFLKITYEDWGKFDELENEAYIDVIEDVKRNTKDVLQLIKTLKSKYNISKKY